MKKLFIRTYVLGSLFLLSSILSNADMIIEIAGKFKVTHISGNIYRCTCEPPYNQRCLTIWMRDNGTSGVIFGEESPTNEVSSFKKDMNVNTSNVFQNSSGVITFTKVD